jgi:7,8-dihydro-6-hydroxymethylpterin-pyrophosphokinase
MGRIKNDIRYQPRVIDIDILTFSDIILNQKELVIPHCKIKSRKFILKPWTDIASDYILPNSKKTIKELLDNISHFDDEVREYH